MKGTLDIHRQLLALDVPHEVVRLPKVILSADELPEALGLDPRRCVAVRLYEADGELVAVIMPGGELPDPVRLLNLLSARTLRAVAADQINSVTDFAAGLVPPLLLPSSVLLVADATVVASEVVYLPTGETGTAIGMRSQDLIEVCGATVAELSLTAEELISLGDLEYALANPNQALRLEDLPARASQSFRS
ncbi:MAG: aminoacyl-tRNA deacylase [Mycobacteriales bacterium]